MANIINKFEITNDFTITDDILQVKTNGTGSLDISGNIIIGSSTSDNAKLIVKNTNNSIIELKANNSEQIETTKSITNKSGVLEFTSNASLNTCLYEFNVGDNDSVGFMNSNGNNKPGIVFGRSGTGSLSVNNYQNAHIFYSTVDGGTINNALNLTGEKLIFNTSSGNFNTLLQAMIIDTSGNVGMGTTPSVSLDVGGVDAIRIPYGTTAQRPLTDASGCIRYNTENSSYEGFGAGSTWGSLGGVKDVDQDTYISAETKAGDDNDQLKFYTGGSERMIIDSNGNVGIGTDSPESKLDISGGHLMIADKTNAKETGIVELYTDDNKAGCLLGTYKMEESLVNFINNGTQTVSPGAVSKITTNWNRWADSTNLIYKSTTSTVGFECNVGVATGQGSSYVYCGLRTADDIDRSSTHRQQNITYALFSVSTGGSSGQRYMRAYYKGTDMTGNQNTTGWAYASGKYEMKVDPTSQIVSIYYNGGVMWNFPTALTWSNYPIRVMASVYSGRIFNCKVVTPGYTPLSVHNERAINLSAESINFYTHGASTTNHGYTALDDINTDINNSSPILSINDSVSTFSGSIKIDNPGIIWLGSYIKHLPTSENTYIGFPDVNTISFGTNSARRMTIQPDGKVGIGTSSPTTALTIRKPIDNSSYGSGTKMIDFKSYYPGYDEESVKASIYCGVSNKNSLSTTAGFLAFMTTDGGILLPAERMRIERDGNVGIGTSSPDTPLHIEKAHSNPNSSVIDTLLTLRTPPGSTDCNSDDAFKIGIDFVSNDNIIGGGPPTYPYNNTTSRIVSMINPVGLNTTAHSTSQERSSALAFYTSNDGTCAERVRIDYNGNVGIGTSSPEDLLTVGEGGGLGAVFDNTSMSILSRSENSDAILYFGTQHDKAGGKKTAIYVEGNGTGQGYSTAKLHFCLENTTGVSNHSSIPHSNTSNAKDAQLSDARMTIQPDGNVGIGTTTPDMKLHIKTDGGDGIKLESTNSSGAGFMYIQRNTDGKCYVMNDGNQALILGVNNNFSQLYLKENGLVGIGTNSPDETLEIMGSFSVNGGDGKLIINSRVGNNSIGSETVALQTRIDGGIGINAAHLEKRYALSLQPDHGYVGIGTLSPEYKLHVNGNVKCSHILAHTARGLTHVHCTGNVVVGGNYAATNSADGGGHLSYQIGYNQGYGNGTIGIAALKKTFTRATRGAGYHHWTDPAWNWHVSIFSNGDMLCDGSYRSFSDRRIKKNIVELDDHESLNLLRKIEVKKYNYIDTDKGLHDVYGFIAQQVDTVKKGIVTKGSCFIPNIMKYYTAEIDTSNNEIIFTDLSGCTNISNSVGPSGEIIIRFEVKTQDKEEYNQVDLPLKKVVENKYYFPLPLPNKVESYIFVHGIYVHDFHTLDKQKIFALNFSATQEIDKIQQVEKTKLTAAETEINSLKNSNAVLLNKIATLESQYYNLQQQVQTLINNQ